MTNNIITLTDSYKFTHWKQYPEKTESVYSYFESRGGKFDRTVFFGMQYMLEEYFAGQVVTREKIEDAAQKVKRHLGDENLFNRAGWEHILDNHGGRLPLVIRSVKEGTVVPTKNVLVTVENTDPLAFWLTNYVETLLVQLWYPITVATQSREMKRLLLRYAGLTGELNNLVDFSLHDFGFRGVSSVESAGLGGAAHLINFKGTDTFAGIDLIDEYYQADLMPGFSIPAYEHSTVISWGRSGESACLANGLHQFPNGLMAIVIDSYDMFNFCSRILAEHKDTIKNRKGCLVVRPDSGDPKVVIVRILDMLAAQFGYGFTSTGHKILPDYIRTIIGDGITFDSLEGILKAIMEAGYSTLNVAFGSGGGLLQHLNRDTCSFAFKCSNIVVDGNSSPVYKDPITGQSKKSKRGRLCLLSKGNGVYKTKENCDDDNDGVLEKVFENGEIKSHTNFEDIVKRAQLKAWSDL